MLNQLRGVYSSLQKHNVRDDLIASKRAAGREKDLEDIRLLELK